MTAPGIPNQREPYPQEGWQLVPKEPTEEMARRFISTYSSQAFVFAWRAALATAPAQPTGWLPIASAPGDMRPILAFEPASRVPFQEEPDEIHIAYQKRLGVFVRQYDDHVHVNATHWMPLPTPPTSGDRG